MRRVLVGVLAAVLACTGLAGIPASAAFAMPRIHLTGGAPEVSRTYTATPSDPWPDDVTPHYQWFRGDHDQNHDSFVPIDGATGQSYTLVDADHYNTVLVEVTAYRDGSPIGRRSSAPSNWILYNMAPPVLSGVPRVGHTITATPGPWATEWWVTLSWRRTGVDIPGETGWTYRARPADAGKEISILAIGEYEYPNGVHPIDRYASRIRIRWSTRSILRGASSQRGRLNLTAIAYAAGADQSSVRGRLRVYDGTRLVRSAWLSGGRKKVSLSHLRRGRHQVRMVFETNRVFAGSSVTRTFTVR